MKIIFATHNPGKIIEMKSLLSDLAIEVLSAEEAGIKDEVTEDGKTFAENSLKKARFAAQVSGGWAVADDSGICLEALAGRPGVHSARWAGAAASGKELVDFTLEQIKDIESAELAAHFASAVALVSPTGREWVFQGQVDGQVIKTPRGEPRPKLPYDVIFVPQGQQRTFAEMTEAEKNQLSHRGIAFAKLKDFLRKLL